MNFENPIPYLKKYQIEMSEEQLLANSKKTVVVGMSGGVDSSASAAIVKMMGYQVIGIFMRNWEEIDADGVCTAEEEYQDVISVCEKLNITYYSVNFSEEYKNFVFKDFVRDYKAGHTPNPDILCNREIKFKVFYEKIKEFGADYLATGHYCQNINNQLVKGHDQNKDQTYFLYTMQSDVLENVLFPVGHLEKKYVRQIAEDFDLITHNKKDSTGICFIGERNFKNFLSQYIVGQKGFFHLLESGAPISEHDGLCFYTIGQRKGLGLGGPGGPWFVAKKDIEKNIVYVVEGENHPALYTDNLIADEESWVHSRPSFPLKCQAKIRYRQADQACTVHDGPEGLLVEFENPQRAVSLRQSIVFYNDTICMGGAIVKTAGESYFDLGQDLPTKV
jgi:tRNA-specific 2-thiouridylase